MLYYNIKKYDKAFSQFKKLSDTKPNDHETIYLIGLCQMETGNINEAIENFNSAIKIKVSMEDCSYYQTLAQAYDKRFNLSGEFDDLIMARDFYKKTLEIDSKNEEVWYKIAVCSAKQGLWDDCVNFCQKVIELNDQAFEAYNQIGLAMYCSGEYDKAASMYRKALAINPKFSDVYTNFGYVLEKQGDFKESVKMFRKFLELKPNADSSDIVDSHIKELENSINLKNN